jgi:Protein of unknown function (DUF2924)
MIDTASALAELAALDRPALAKRWQAAFEVPAPRGCQATLLRHALAWHVQMQALHKGHNGRQGHKGRQGGAGKARSATQVLNKASSGSVTLSPGTRLLREWQGQTHHVTVVERGFEYEGKVWRSLSGIARSITGTPWSGPVFFGLKT